MRDVRPAVHAEEGAIVNRIAIAAVIAASLSGTAAAEPEPYMVKENPNELAMIAESACEDVSSEALTETVRGVLVRSRIQPLLIARGARSPSATVLLSVLVDCAGHEAFTVTVEFLGPGFRHGYHPAAGRIGNYENQPQYLLIVAREATEEAITEYLQANFPELETQP